MKKKNLNYRFLQSNESYLERYWGFGGGVIILIGDKDL